SKDCEFVRGDGVVREPGVVEVNGRELRYDKLVVATGSSPRIPPIDGLDGIEYWTNREATETLEVPRRLVVLGGGPVGCALAQFLQGAGSQVTIVEGGDRLLGRVDADAAVCVAHALAVDGVDVRLGVQAVSAASDNLALSDGTDVPFDRLLVATGRRPNVEGL